MTLSVLGTDGAGAVGIAVASSSPAVAARCVHLRPLVGGALSQNVTDPRLGPLLLDALEEGLDPRQAVERTVRERPDIEHRQLAVLTMSGDGAAFSGAAALGVHAERVGRHVAAVGNLLASPCVVDAMVDAFERSADGEASRDGSALARPVGELEERLLSALLAGLTAGGEAGPVRSAGLAVVRRVPWPETDLRVDWADDPMGSLRDLLSVWLPQRDDYVLRALQPVAAPAYGVPGDE
ncbi:DUF1028 domain-containing protein [Acidimicrobiaceae bacterium USS-CC1]|uniref:DUF1028 domain-containing protein n=1 Tax=Acidiferrimicrobium australe TaxID=2664430 RepID=A0ABW9QQ86_9ACTN|nr:DUF1028 domain-containing protein [Acidiferrimicrobium australe]